MEVCPPSETISWKKMGGTIVGKKYGSIVFPIKIFPFMERFMRANHVQTGQSNALNNAIYGVLCYKRLRAIQPID